MATYVIGDLQGCFRSLMGLLDTLEFDSAHDQLWFAGDLVNRGPGSLECLRFVYGLGNAAVSVLGNHDLHLLAVAHGIRERGKFDSLQDVLDAPDREDLISWLRRRPLLVQNGSMFLVHAAIPPVWDPDAALAAARDVENTLRGPKYPELLRTMYGDKPAAWRDVATDHDRHRYTINAMTRARCFDLAGDMDLRFKGPPEEMPKSKRAWYDSLHPAWQGCTVFAGHWSAAGIRQGTGYVTLDSGCVWGGSLTAYCLESQKFISVPCAPGDRASSPE